MHDIQKKILELAKTSNIASLKLREIGELVGEPHPQKIKHHLNQLFKKGFLKQNKEKTVITPVSITNKSGLFISLPILGSANCGQALVLADENFEGYLQISKSLLPSYIPNEYFVIKALGNSMNKANIKGKTLEDGDYAVICKGKLSDYNNKYVLSIINGMANIKKLVVDRANQQIVLLSESTQEYSPIYIHTKDFSNYLINGVVVDVIKKPSI